MDIKTGNGTFSFRCLSAGYFVGKAGWVYPRDHAGSFKLIYMLHGELNIQEGSPPFIYNQVICCCFPPRFPALGWRQLIKRCLSTGQNLS